MYVPLSDDKHQFVRENSKKVHWKSETKFSLRQNLRIFFRQKFFPDKNSPPPQNLLKKHSWILSWAEFCLGLHTAVVFRMQLFNSFVCWCSNKFDDTNDRRS